MKLIFTLFNFIFLIIHYTKSYYFLLFGAKNLKFVTCWMDLVNSRLTKCRLVSQKLTVMRLQLSGLPKRRSRQLAKCCSISAVTGSLAVCGAVRLSCTKKSQSVHYLEIYVIPYNVNVIGGFK